MEGLEAEVTQNIRNAIKKKLTDLGAFVDDELPEYIMVMVANKRSKPQMEEYLSLFLSDNTLEFTNWLHDLLKNLKYISTGSSNFDDNVASPQIKTDLKKDLTHEAESFVDHSNSDFLNNDVHMSSDVEDGDVLALEAVEHEGDDFLSQELQDENSLPKKKSEAEDSLCPKPQDESLLEKKSSKTSEENFVPEKSSPKAISISFAEKKKSERMTAKEHFVKQSLPKFTKALPIQHESKPPSSSSTSYLVQNSNDVVMEDEYDPMHPSVGSVASVVRITGKKPCIPPTKRPNSLLLLRAMDDANKSVMGKEKINDFYKPTPIKVLVSANRARAKRNSFNDTSFGFRNMREEKHEPDLPVRKFLCGSSVRKPVEIEDNVNSDLKLLQNYFSTQTSRHSGSDARKPVEVAENVNSDSILLQNYLPTRTSRLSGSSTRKPIKVTDNVNNDLKLLQNYFPNQNSDSDSDDDHADFSPERVIRTVQENDVSVAMTEYSPEDEKCVAHVLADKTNSNKPSVSESPHFVVTLDGYDEKSFKRKRNILERVNFGALVYPDVTVDDYNSHIEESSENIEETETKKQKLNEKCRFWPACKNGDECAFHHPSVVCKAFPKCKYGGKCLYIHPDCKFDALCSRKDCPYTHTTRRDFIHGTTPSKASYLKPMCKFFPNCGSNTCPFVHPKQCRYGSECQIHNCSFSHHKLPSRQQMKWTATVPS